METAVFVLYVLFVPAILDLLAAGRLFILFIDGRNGFLEFANSRAEGFAHLRQPFGSKEQHHDNQDDHEFPGSDIPHRAISFGREETRKNNLPGVWNHTQGGAAVKDFTPKTA